MKHHSNARGSQSRLDYLSRLARPPKGAGKNDVWRIASQVGPDEGRRAHAVSGEYRFVGTSLATTLLVEGAFTVPEEKHSSGVRLPHTAPLVFQIRPPEADTWMRIVRQAPSTPHACPPPRSGPRSSTGFDRHQSLQPDHER